MFKTIFDKVRDKFGTSMSKIIISGISLLLIIASALFSFYMEFYLQMILLAVILSIFFYTKDFKGYGILCFFVSVNVTFGMVFGNLFFFFNFLSNS